jgi:hypothetical protein
MKRTTVVRILFAILLSACSPAATPTPLPTATPTATAVPPTPQPTAALTATPVPPPTFPSWERVTAAGKAAIATLPGYAEFPENATTWADYAERCFEELLTLDDCWFTEPSTGIKGFRPYVKGTDGWGGADRTREITELMAEMDVLWPMYRYLQLHPDPERQAMVDEFINELPKYHDAAVKQTVNRPGEDKHDSWYFMENSVLKYGHLYLITGAAALEEPYFGSLQSAIEMAHNFDYLFPQFVNLAKERADGYNTNNYCTSGLLSYSLLHAYQMTGDTDYLAEAEKALTKMREVSHPFNLLYEPQELAAAAAAAAQMAQYADLIGSSTDFSQLAVDFFYAQEQMVYSDGGKTNLPGFRPERSDWLPNTWRDGLHSPYYNPEEAGGINAPAFKEAFESVMFWADYLKHMRGQPGFVAEEPLRILNLNRIKNFYFFSPNIPDDWERDYGPISLQYIPYEDIDYYDVREHEDRSVREKAGYNGKQVYGAGETLWAYLLFEALGEASDPNALIVNLNVFDKEYPPAAADRAYMVFNPYSAEETLTFTLKHLSEPYELYAGSSNLGDFQPGDSFAITLPARGSAYITLRAG